MTRKTACSAGCGAGSELPPDLDLIETMGEIRRGKHLAAGRKVTVFLDQFEQWLHSHKPEDTAVLVQALRQCDGRDSSASS